jgi:AraC-like DNA-binding protein
MPEDPPTSSTAGPTRATVAERPKGVVDPATARRMFRLERYVPAPDLAPFLDHHWLVEWDLRGRPPHVQRTLPYPCVNLVFDQGEATVFGVVRGAYEHELRDANRALGVRFRAGGFRAFLGRPVHTLTDGTVPLSAVLGPLEPAAVQAVFDAADDAGMVAAAEALLRRRLPPPDPQVQRIGSILAIATQDPGLTRVQDLAERASLPMRTLQHLFSDHVGVSPKWVIRRYRLHDAADRLAQGEDIDLATLAQSLGYFDQAHFTRDFQRLVGQSPAAYRRAAAS